MQIISGSGGLMSLSRKLGRYAKGNRYLEELINTYRGSQGSNVLNLSKEAKLQMRKKLREIHV